MVESTRINVLRGIPEEENAKYLQTTVSRISTQSDIRLTEYGGTYNGTIGFMNQVDFMNPCARPSVDQRKPMNFVGEKLIGNGSFGVVYQARIAETGEVIAVKKIFQDRRYKNRELQIMQELDHCNIVKLKYSFITQENFVRVILSYFNHCRKKLV